MVHLGHFASLALIAGASAQAVKGFNYGSTFTDGSAKAESDFANEFTTAQNLVGASGFTNARLFTSIQAGTANSPIAAIPAAISTKTSLLLGLWASAGEDGINNEIAALQAAVAQYGSDFVNLVTGISVGSEDLYRISPTGIENMSGIGAGPDELTSYIGQVRSALSGTALSGIPIGHVDTWTAWVNGSNAAVVNAVDFVGMDAYPYFQTTMANTIENSKQEFTDAYQATIAAAAGKPVWVTETGWPVSGDLSGQAVASIENAKTYWDEVGCSLFGSTNVWWFTLQDSAPSTPNPSFGIIGSTLTTTPLFDLSCSGSSSSSSAAPSSTPVPSSSAAPSSAAPSSAAPSSAAPSSVAPSSATPSSVAPSSAAPSSAAPSAPAVPTTLATSYVPSNSAPVSEMSDGQPVATAVASSSCPPEVPVTSAAPPPPASTPSGACPADLSGNYEYPHLIVPVDSSKPDEAFGTSYDGTFSPTVSSLFNFDIPASDAGKTCTLVFLLPEQSQLETSSFTLSSGGGIDVSALTSPATEQTTYNTIPAIQSEVGSVASVTPGNSYVITSGACAAGQRIGYEVKSTGGLDLEYFQDYNPSPIGLYITVC